MGIINPGTLLLPRTPAAYGALLVLIAIPARSNLGVFASLGRPMPALEIFQRRLNMKRPVVLSFVVLLGSIALAAQTASQNQPSWGVSRMEGLSTASTTTTIILPGNIGCPVFLRAQHAADGGLLNVDKRRPERPGQLLHLTLTNPDSRQIVAARVRVHGLSGKGRVTQTMSGADRPDATSTIEVQLVQGSGKEAYGDLRVPNMTAVLSIDLNSVTYADGSTGSFTGHDACRVVPDKLMLIAGH